MPLATTTPEALAGPDRPQHCDLIVHNAAILTMDDRDSVVADGAIAIRNGRIVALDSQAKILAGFTSDRSFDAAGGTVHPGFIDAHIHVSQYTARSVLPLMERTSATMGHWKGELTPEDEHASALMAALDYLKCGYTGFVDPGTVFAPDAVAAVAEEACIRVWLTDPYVADGGEALAANLPELVSGSFLARWPQNTDEALKRLGSQLFRNRNKDSLVKGFIGLYGEGTDSPELFEAALGLARDHGVRLQEHLGYLPAFQLKREETLGQPLLQWLEDRGFLDPHLTFVHMNLVREGEVSLLAKYDVRVVWCPWGQLQMLGQAGAQARMVELHRSGVAVGIASDIPRVADFDALGTLAASASAASGRPAMPRELMRMRTIGAAASIGAEGELGSLEIGKRADFVVRGPSVSVNFGFDAGLELGVIGGRDTVEAVFVAGRQVVEKGRVLGLDERAVIAAAHRSARALASRIGLRG
ncbi:amidohydrolase family protein [Mesorhizobium sp. CA8]|uniref:amidohydrolase family protein n=1 Tax=unclassified Mesorhizobium TaxID=325217 RepID=UPI001CCC057F|nr:MULTISPECIES: amidohydrolase family protein [unclassified Mesorhizobium]MBZ9761752.1 amidohydrolase family protein [Mesorhizobium sp. CA8]MBZ9820495.1 amidohydrolase family protein [Mesorhizobium sp. CA4]